jgi:hypothetical protein
MLNYLNFFREFARVTHGIEVMIDNTTERGSIVGDSHSQSNSQSASSKDARAIHRVHCIVSSLNASQEQVSALLADYIKRVFADPTHDGEVEIHTAVSRYESDLFLILYKRALADIRTDVRFRFLTLSSTECEAIATSFALLSMPASDDTVPEASHKSANAEHVQQMIRAMEALQLPSERIEVPPSLYQAMRSIHGMQSVESRQQHQQNANAPNQLAEGSEKRLTASSTGTEHITGERLERLRYALADLADELDRSSLLAPTLNRRFAMVIEDVEDLLQAASECAKKGEPLEGVWRVQMLVERALNLALRSEHEEIIAVVRSAARAVSELVEEVDSAD